MHWHLNITLSNVAAETGESIAVAGLPNLHEVSLPVLREILCDKFEDSRTGDIQRGTVHMM